MIYGTAGNDSLVGTAGDDLFIGGVGYDVLNGMGGTDTAIYAAPMAGYRFGMDAAGRVTLTDVDATTGGDDGIDTLLDIERVQFSDGTVGLRPYVETQVNSTTAGNQRAPAIAALADGTYVVAWLSYDTNDSITVSAIYTQRFDADGAALGGEVLITDSGVSAPSTKPEKLAIAAMTDGGYVLAWKSDGQVAGEQGIHTQRFDGSGAAVSGETQINTSHTYESSLPAITTLADGGYVVAWQTELQDGGGSGIYAQRFAGNGQRIGEETLVNTDTAADQRKPSLAALADGGFVVTWESFPQDGSDSGIYAQRFDAKGTKAGGETLMNTTTAGEQVSPDVAGLPDGGFVVVWASWWQDGHFYGVYAQRFDAEGAKVGGETQVNTYTTSDQHYPAITALAGGGFAVTWTSWWQDGSGNGIYAQRFDAAGVPLGGEMHVSTATLHNQQVSAIAALPDGGLVVTWYSDTQDKSGTGVYAQRFDAQGDAVRISGDAGANALGWSGTLGVAIEGGDGDDTLSGGPGNDRIAGGLGADTLDGGLGHDVADYAGAGAGVAAYLTWEAGNRGEAEGDVFASIEGLDGSAYDDILSGNESDNVVLGGAGNDWLFGREGQDTLRGGAGNDVLSGGSGHKTAASFGDLLDGGEGADVAYYRDAPQTVFRVSEVGPKAGMVDGMSYGIGIDVVNGANNFGEAVGDVLVNIENIWGSRFADVIRGADDVGGQVYGFEGDDILDGRGGDDALYGGAGYDTLTGGAGADAFFYLSWNDHYNPYGTLEAYEGGDTITDFEQGIDQITVSRYWFGFGNIGGPAAALTAEHTDFITNGTNAASNRPTFFWNSATGELLFDADGTGGTGAVNIATLAGGVTLTLADIWSA